MIPKPSLSTYLAYYTAVCLPIALVVLFYMLVLGGQSVYEANQPINPYIFVFKLFWFTGALVAISNIIGLFLGHPDHHNAQAIEQFQKDGWDPHNKLVIVYVSRGDNKQALIRSIAASQSLLKESGISYRIDAVTDIDINLKATFPDSDIVYHLVPANYQTTNHAKWKARALQYVVEQHRHDLELNPDKTWLLHLDEESQVHLSSLSGIHQFVSNSENTFSIGQGEIRYNAHQYSNHLLITWMDSIRSGDDIGRFRFQYKIFGRPLFGMHGSYFLVPYHLEQQYGYDLGGRGSITEDAYFALKCAEQGVTFRWLNGYIREQSPYNITAIIKQRKRWFCGLWLLAFDNKIAFRTRLPLIINTLLWSVAWAGPTVGLIALFFVGSFPWYMLLAAALLQGFYASVYTVGAQRNIQDLSHELSLLRKIKLYLGSLAAMPIVNLIEGYAVLYGILRPVRTFEVVNKN